MEILRNSQVSRAILLLTIILLFSPLAYCRIIYVDDDGQADFNTIQAAIDDSNDGDVVLVAAGTYTSEGNRDIDFKGKAITVKSEDGPQTCLIDCQGSENEQHRGFYFHNGEVANSVVQGFTITNGYVRERGGGICCLGSSPCIIDCILTRNAAYEGGGIACYESDIIVRGCIITRNIASEAPWNWYSSRIGAGGGIAIIRGHMHNKPLFSNCIISGNSTSGDGGGVSCTDNPVLVNCTISENRTGEYGAGGGIAGVAGHGDKGLLRHCIIWGNTANVGDQISNMPGGILGEMLIEIEYCVVQNGPNDIDDPTDKIKGSWTSKEPQFVNPGYWEPYEPNSIPFPPGFINYRWIEGDYHLKSQAGRWDPSSQSWIQDDVTSPCIDAGDPNSPIGSEPFPNGGIINMGAYGGTAQASKSLIGTSTYAFVSEQSTIVQTGGIAGVNWTYSLSGQLQLTVNFGEGKAWFSNIDATATDSNEPDRKLNLNDVFNLTSLNGTIDTDGSIQFTGQATDGSDVLLVLTLSDESVSLKGQTTPPPNSADFFIFNLDAVAKRKYGGGTGELNNPYLIYTAEHLNALGAEPNDWYKHFKLMADIDLAGYSYDHALIAPDIDTDEYYFQGTPFAGVFDGNGHTISHLTITGVSCLGLFGELAYGAELKDLGVTDVNISGTGDFVGGLLGRNSWGAVVIRCYSTGAVYGDDDIGGLVGSNHGNIIQCYSTSAASGDYIIGGLLGGNEQEGTLTNCYSTGAVNGNDALAGLLGFNLGQVTHCYCTGSVTGNQRVGGLVGWNYGAVASNFWDTQTSGRINMCGSQEESASGCDDSSGLITDEMQTASTFLEAGWDLVDETENGTEDIWWIREGQDYPRLWWETHQYSGGTGEPNDPYQIYTAEQLNAVGNEPNNWDKYFKLMADIDMSGYSYNAALIGPDGDSNDPYFQGTSFTGVFDGNGHTIYNLTITGQSYLGLFGRTEYATEIKDLSVVDVNITGTDYVGGLVGFNSGSITSISITGSINGDNRVGGIAGRNWGSINTSLNEAAVTGYNDVGGLTAGNYGTITNSYNTGAVSANSDIGGLVGENYGTIDKCYSTGAVSGEKTFGGFVGFNWENAIITSSFWDVETSGQATSAGGTGKTTAEMQTISTFLEAGWDFVDEMVNGTEDIWFFLEDQDYPRLWWEIDNDLSP